MEFKTYQTIFRNFSLVFLLLLSLNTFSCGWSESSETTRLAFFRASISSFLRLNDYTYSADAYMANSKVSDRDQRINCQEWVKKLNNDILPNDVYKILYKTESEKFQNALISNNLKNVFKDNSFIDALVLPKNKAFLEYISLAKQMEYYIVMDSKWENWDVLDRYDTAKNYSKENPDLEKTIASTTDNFLKQRYAFLLLREAFYENYHVMVKDLYKKYFENNKTTILAPWAMYYMALGLEDKAEANYYLSKVMVACDDKGNAAVRHFDLELLNKTLKLAQNDFEKGVILAMNLMHNPAPQLENLKEVSALIPDSQYFSFLVQREINKIEDWIFTPKYTSQSPSVVFNEEQWYKDYEKAKAENQIKDFKYLKELKSFLIDIEAKSSGEQKDFLSAAIAQLCFINDELDLGNQYANQISSNANPSIQLQKNIQLALVSLKQNDICNEETKEKLYQCFNQVENAVENDETLFKSKYSLFKIAGHDFLNKKDVTTAGLLLTKSQNTKNHFNDFAYYIDFRANRYNEYIGYFDRIAKPSDIDVLINLVQKTNKTNFEKYICAGTIANNINVYKDLKGTLAFRENDLELASKTFDEMPKDFWKKNYEFKNYLNENPFFPKVLQYTGTRNFKYDFNKAQFLRTMLKLKNSKSASDNLKFANAYFNVSVYGNAWMMISYELSGGQSYNEYIYGDSYESKKQYGLGNYFYLNLAKQYYQKALQLSKNREQKAVCNLMIFECNYYGYDSSTDPNKKFVAGSEIKDFYTNYEDTKVFAKYYCPLLQAYIN